MAYTTHTTLLARVAAGVDPAAWTEFHQRYGDLLRGFARRRGLQDGDCDDVAQEVLLILARTMPGFEYDPARGRFRSYLKTLAVRTMQRRFRQNRRPADLGGNEDLVADEAGTDDAWETEWRRHHVRRAMRRLEAEFGANDREAFAQYVVRGRAAAETAEALGLSVDQVYQAKSRMLRRLAALIAEQVDDEG